MFKKNYKNLTKYQILNLDYVFTLNNLLMINSIENLLFL